MLTLTVPNSKVDYDEPHKINVTYGYSRDAHPELVQVMEQMMVDNATGIPLYMEPESGNTNDTNAFGRMTKIFESFRKYTDDGYLYLCGDSALYSKKNVTHMSESGIKFVTRAADGNLNSVQKFIAEHRNDELEEIDDVNQGGIYEVEDCGIKQKWLLVHSDTAESRNVHSVESFAQKELLRLQKKIKEYGKSCFSCEPDAQKEIERFSKNFRYCKLVSSGIVKEEIPRRGRKPKAPVPEEEKQYRYKIELEIGINQEYCDMVRRNRSFFVVATNDVEREWKPAELLKQYKSQNRVERGFRFLKDPEFFADSIFVSKNEHIQALLMIMTLGLAVFSGLEWKLRNAMKESNVQLPNQTGKLTDMFWTMVNGCSITLASRPTESWRCSVINTKRLTVANFFAQVLRDEINHVQVRNVSYMLTRVIQPGIRSRIIQDRQIPGCILQGLIYNGLTT